RSQGRRVMQVRKMTELEQRMTDDLDWAEHAPEVQQNPDHYGKFVVVHNKRVLAAGTDSRALVEQAAEQVGVPWQQLVILIVHRPEIFFREIPDRKSVV